VQPCNISSNKLKLRNGKIAAIKTKNKNPAQRTMPRAIELIKN